MPHDKLKKSEVKTMSTPMQKNLAQNFDVAMKNSLKKTRIKTL